jgi:coproporphyrinogen III oxidase-like Fe-S oxidoreductase
MLANRLVFGLVFRLVFRLVFAKIGFFYAGKSFFLHLVFDLVFAVQNQTAPTIKQIRSPFSACSSRSQQQFLFSLSHCRQTKMGQKAH